MSAEIEELARKAVAYNADTKRETAVWQTMAQYKIASAYLTQAERVVRLEAALTDAAEQFEFYEREHRSKYEAYDPRCDGPVPPRDRLEKAETNGNFARKCRAALATPED